MLFNTFFSLSYAFSSYEDGIFLHARRDGRLFNLTQLQAKIKVKVVLIKEMLFADDAALVTHFKVTLQELISCFVHICTDIGLTISVKKTNLMGQDIRNAPSIPVSDQKLEAVEELIDLTSTESKTMSLAAELNKCISKTASTMEFLFT